MNKLNRINLVWTMLWLVMLLAACTTSWVTEAQNIITLLGPAISSALAILAAFGVGLSPTVATAFQDWSKQAISGLAQVKTQIDAYNAAPAQAKAGILTQIQTVLSDIANNLTALLPTIKITNPKTQAEVLAVIEAVASEMGALISLVPALKGEVSSHDELKALIGKLKTAKEFKADFNSKVAALGPEAKKYQI